MVHQNFTDVSPVACREVKRFRVKSETFVSDGLLSSTIVNEVFDKFGDENNHFRDFSLQTLIRAQAVELLQPVGALPYSQLKAADKLGEITSNFDGLYNQFNELSQTIRTLVKSSDSVATPTE